MFKNMFSFVCCCFPTLTSVRTSSPSIKHKHETAFIISCPTSTQCHLSPIIIPCTPTTANSTQHLFYEDSMMTSIDGSSTLTTDTSSSSQPVPNRSSPRISAIRELIETEQRYVNDLRIVSNEFIKPLNNTRIISDYEIEQLFSNWFGLIACNAVLLNALQKQVHYKEHVITLDDDVSIRIPRSASMSNIAIYAQASFSRQPSHSSVERPLDSRTGAHGRRRRSPSPKNLTLRHAISTQRVDDNVVPQSSQTTTTTTTITMEINESTQIGEILCSYIPYMADAYFQYCNCRSQANKNLQIKIDQNRQFRTSLKLFQNKTGGLSLNGFLTKPIQRVTRYPLLIDQILRHTPSDHADHRSIQQALECARKLTERINKKISEQENQSRLDWLQQHMIFGTDDYFADGYIFDELLKFNSATKFHRQRQLIFHGSITKVPSGKELAAFLFNDFLLLSMIKSSPNNWQSQLFEYKSNLQLKLYRSPYFLTDIVSTSETLDDTLSFSIVTKAHHKPLLLKTKLDNVRTLWVRSINTAVEECRALQTSITNDRASFSETSKIESAVARLNLVVSEAYILLPSTATSTSSRHRAINPYCEITVGSSTLRTPFIKRTNRPKWNTSMQFLFYNLTEDIIHINISDHEYFSPDENICYATMYLPDILPCPLDVFRSQLSQTFMQTIYLNNGTSMNVKCTVEFLSSSE